MNDKYYYMSLALKEANKAYNKDEVPVGCIIVSRGTIIAKAYNNKVSKNDPTAHAEVECIKKACKKLNSSYLNECEMYVTLEPCLMCAGSIINSRIKKVYIGTKDPKGGSFGSNIDVTIIKGLNHYPKVEIGILEDECSSILKNFFKAKRKQK
ncbi:MAG: tRNA adenosine(34) deaminase TadA [Erysipelotrichaceae bacterium]|nr:tRNA adenosine(34) deaminase TadA [Erysipelotrichaceae bacterium]